MRRFAALYTALDATTSTRDKLDALIAYFRTVPPEDAAWASYFLAGGKPRQSVPTRLLVEIARERAGLPEWLFDESYEAVGDLAETIAHVLPPAARTTELGLAQWIEDRLLLLRGAAPETLRERLTAWWDELDWSGRFLLTKLIGGGFRVGVARQLVVRALADVAGVDHKLIAQRMVGWTDSRQTPDAARYLRLVAPALQESVRDGGAPAAQQPLRADLATQVHAGDAGLPYPFFLAHPLQDEPLSLGARGDWLVEWKWDGIRAQLVKRAGCVWLWSRGEDLITDRFPEIEALGRALPDGYVIDGEILAWAPGAAVPLPFAQLQPRITRKTLTKKVLTDYPATFVAYDLLEAQGEDLRTTPLEVRRARLERLGALGLPDMSGESAAEVAAPPLRLSPLVTAAEAPDWTALAALREESRERGVEGLMLKGRESLYGVGRTKTVGAWWKWRSIPTRWMRCCSTRSPDTAGAPACIRTSRSPYGTRPTACAPWCPSPRPIRASRTQRCARWMRSCARRRSRSSARCAACGLRSCSKSASRVFRRVRGTNRAWPCVFRACCAGVRTRALKTPIRSPR